MFPKCFAFAELDPCIAQCIPNSEWFRGDLFTHDLMTQLIVCLDQPCDVIVACLDQTAARQHYGF